MTIADKVFSLLPDMVSVKRYQKTVHGEPAHYGAVNSN